jgi:hypothetical protein
MPGGSPVGVDAASSAAHDRSEMNDTRRRLTGSAVGSGEHLWPPPDKVVKATINKGQLPSRCPTADSPVRNEPGGPTIMIFNIIIL